MTQSCLQWSFPAVCLAVLVGAGNSATSQPSAVQPAEPLPVKERQAWQIDVTKESEATVRIRQSLQAQMEMKFPNVTLRKAIGFVEQNHNIKIRFDEPALAGVARSPEDNVNVDKSGVTLRNALQMLIGKELDIVVDDGFLLITTAEIARNTLETRFYDLAPLLKHQLQDKDLLRLVSLVIDPLKVEHGTLTLQDSLLIIRQNQRSQRATTDFLYAMLGALERGKKSGG